MKNSKYSGSNEYKKAMRLLEIGCNCKLSLDPNKIYF